MNAVMLLSKTLCYDGRVQKEAGSLLRHGIKVKVFEWNRSGQKTPLVKGIETKTFSLVAPIRHWKLNLILFPVFWAWCFFYLLKDGFDVVHCHDLDTLLPGLLAAKLKRKKIVFDAHEHYPSMISSQSAFAGKMALFLEKLLLPKVDRVITVSEHRAEILRKEGAKSITIITNSAVLEDFSFPAEKISGLKKEIAGNKFLLVYIGSLNPNRSLEELVEALGGMKNVFLFIAGIGSLEESLKELAEAFDNVKVSGKIAFEDLPLYVAIADAIPLIRDADNLNNQTSSPNKFFEAVAVGKPLIVSRGSYTEKIADGLCVSVDYGSLSQLSTAVKKLAENKKLYRKLCANAVLARKDYNWKKNEEKLCMLYNSLC